MLSFVGVTPDSNTSDSGSSVPIAAIVVPILLLIVICGGGAFYMWRSGKWTLVVLAGKKEREFDTDRGYDQERDFATEVTGKKGTAKKEVQCVGKYKKNFLFCAV